MWMIVPEGVLDPLAMPRDGDKDAGEDCGNMGSAGEGHRVGNSTSGHACMSRTSAPARRRG